ncbi:DUF4160 domain-containing protein [Microcoleus sp. S28C3]|uniref:DUF4160 domain-containing protein n=1 Tax=Microcoleus sp. S28C3 TaxID=3055414 RepID=UPI002FD17037
MTVEVQKGDRPLIINFEKYPTFKSDRKLNLGENSLRSQLMPTVLQVGPYSFIFFSSDRGEPAHIHVKRDRQLAKFWMNPVSLEKNRGFKEHELNQIARLVEEYEPNIVGGLA